MKYSTLTIISTLLFVTIGWSQPSTQTSNINLFFDKMEIQGVDTKQDLLYGYFFVHSDKTALEKLALELTKQSYKQVRLFKNERNDYILHVERKEQHSRQSLFDREQKLTQLAAGFGVSSYDGFDVGNADPLKPLVSNEKFTSLLNDKKGNELFDFGIRLYNLEINDKAELVFKKCLQQHIKSDTSAFKLGNALIAQNKIQEGINQLEEAIKFNPGYLSAYFNVAATSYDNGDSKKALQYYQSANRLKPVDDRILYGIAAAQYALEQYEDARENCMKALNINKNNENAQLLATMLDKIKR